MPLTISLLVQPVSGPASVTGQTLQTMARRANNPHASRPDAVGVTVPRISVNQHGLSYHWHTPTDNQREFQFTSGEIRLTLAQTYYLLSTLNPLESQVWSGHEMLHVNDNIAIFNGGLEHALRNDRSIFLPLFEHQQWLPNEAFATIEDSIRNAVENVFRTLTGEAARRRDTTAEYRSRVAMARGPAALSVASPQRSHARR